MRRSLTALLALVALSSTLSAQDKDKGDSKPPIKSIPRAERPVIAIRDLTFAAQLSPEDQRELNDWQGLAVLLGRGSDNNRTDSRTTMDLFASQLTNMLVAAITETENFRLMDRDKLKSITAEQDLASSNRAAPGQTAAATGQLVAAKYVVTGAITKFGKSEKKSRFGGIAGAITKGAVGIGMTSGSTDYEIGIILRVEDATTGEVITTVKTEGMATGNVSHSIAGFGVAGAVLGAGMSKSTTGEREKKLAQAMETAADLAAIGLVEKRERGDMPK